MVPKIKTIHGKHGTRLWFPKIRAVHGKCNLMLYVNCVEEKRKRQDFGGKDNVRGLE